MSSPRLAKNIDEVLASRLRLVVGEVVFLFQNVFVHGRQILHVVLICE